MWRIYRGYDERRLSGLKAPALWRRDWREWMRWQRATLAGIHHGALYLLADDWGGFARATTRIERDEHSRDEWSGRIGVGPGG